MNLQQTAMHTPGPWDHDGNGLVYSMYVKDEGGTATFICDVSEDSTHAALCGPTPQEEANARLIAASPALLSELEANERLLTEYVEWHHKHQGGCSVEWEQRLEATREIIAQATGRAA
jgi:hypothetical protein